MPELLSRPGIRHIDPVSLTQELIRIPSDKNELRMVARIKQVVTEHFPTDFSLIKIQTEKPTRPSLFIANHETPDLILIAHMDTVGLWSRKQNGVLGEGIHDPLGGVIENGNIYGRGAVDDKGGIAAAMASIVAVGAENPRVGLILTSDEEGSLTGAKHVAKYLENLLARNPGWKPLFVLSMNGNDGNMSTSCRGLSELKFEVIGTTGHSAMKKPDTPPTHNAIIAAVDIIKSLQRIFEKLPESPLGRTTVNLAHLVGGTMDENGEITIAWNRVPDLAILRAELRLNGGALKGEPIDSRSVTKALRQLAKSRKVSIGKIDMGTELYAWNSVREDALWLQKIVESETGQPVEYWIPDEHGFDEIAFIAELLNRNDRLGKKAPAAILGFGPSEAFHQPDEYIGVQDLRTWTAITERALQDSQFKRRTYSLPQS